MLERVATTWAAWMYEEAWEARLSNIRDVRSFVSVCLRRHGRCVLEPDCLLTSGELATNAVVHAGTPFTVTVCGEGGDVVVLVHDQCTRMPEHPRTGGSIFEGGRGLFVVAQCAQEWGVTPDEDGLGKTVWARIAA